MNKTTKLLVAGSAGLGLLLSACEIPGGGEPPRAHVFPNATGRTPFAGFPATFSGTLVGTEPHEPSKQNLISWYDAFTTTVDGQTALVITCSVYDDDTVVYIDGTINGDDYLYCKDGPQAVDTVDGGEVYIEIGTEDTSGRPHAYVVNANLNL